MSSWYLDTSAAIKLIVSEQESTHLIRVIEAERPVLVACRLLETELRRAAQRLEAVTQRHVTELLDRLDLYELNPAVLTQAGLLPGTHLRSLDAVHLAAALAIGVDSMVTYDTRMVDAARDVGLVPLHPGR